MRRHALILVGLATFVALVGAQAAAAGQAAPSFAVRPLKYDPALPETKSYFVLDAQPGATIADKVRVTNVGNAAGSLRLYAVDATTGRTSGTVYLSSTAPRRDASTWIKLSQSVLRLTPGQSRIVPFTVTVPAGASPGDHVAGIVADNETLTQRAKGGAIRIKIKHLTVAAVVVRIPGATAAGLALGQVSASGGHGFQFLNLGLTNSGNVMIKPTGTLTVRDSTGQTVVDKSLQLDTLIPGTSIAYPVSLSAALQPGSYTAEVDFHYGNRVLVDGEGIGGPLTLDQTVPFTVSSVQYTQVYNGTAPLTPAGARSLSPLVLASLAIATLALLLLGGVVLKTRHGLLPR